MAAEAGRDVRCAHPVERASGRAMSCDVEVVVVGSSTMTARDALARIDLLESRWSRFRDDSELTRLNRSAGRPVAVSDDTRRLVVSLVEAWHLTGGAFDPTLLVPLVGLGYAASRDDAAHRTSLPSNGARRGRPDAILVDPVRSTVELPPGTVLDPGGLGKGLAADVVVEELLAAGATGALVEIGGDVRVAGSAPDDDAWTIAVELLPGGPQELVRLGAGGVATSSTRLRTWRRDAIDRHHLLDPATQEPTSGDVTAATAIAGSARWAEVLTKPAFVRGVGEAFDLMHRHGAVGLVATGAGAVVASPGWRRHAVPATGEAGEVVR